jgi:uncharacterized protein (DUF58 family)
LIYPTRRSIGLAGALALIAVVALLVPIAAGAFWAALAIVLGVAVLDARRCLARAPVAIERELPRRARSGQPCEVRYRLRLDSESTASVLDELSVELGGDRRFELPAGALAERQHELSVTPSRRGIHPLGPMYVELPSPLRLFVQRSRHWPQQALSVYPADPLEDRGSALSREVQQDIGLRPRRQRGEGSEFESLREYTFDDDPRRIDWRASARMRRPVVRTYQFERRHTLIVAVDCGRLMSTRAEGRSKLDHALSAALSLARASVRCQDRVGFVAFDRELCMWLPPQRPERALGAILEATLPLETRAYESSYRVLAEAMQQRQRKRALVVVLTDFVEGEGATELRAYLASLRARHCVLLVGLRDRLLRELDQPLPSATDPELYRRLVLQDLGTARDVALEQIARSGVHVLDLDPSEITAPLLDRYLRIRESAL